MNKISLFLLALAVSCSIVFSQQPISIPLKRQNRNSIIVNENNSLRKNTLFAECASGIDFPVMNDKDLLYYIDLQLGEKKEVVTVQIDTGSNILWIASDQLTQDKTFGKYYNCQTSDGCIMSLPQDDYTLSYAGGLVLGSKYSVPMTFGNLPTIKQYFVLANKVEDEPIQKGSGLIGLGPSDPINDNNLSFIQVYYQQKAIPKPIFSVYLGFQSDQSELTLGGINDKYIQQGQTVNFHSSDAKSDRWDINCSKVKLGTIFETKADFFVKVAINSGFTRIGTGEAIWNDIKSALEQKYDVKVVNDEFLAVPCNKIIEISNITFSFPDQLGRMVNYDLEPEFFTWNLNSDYCILPFDKMNIENVTFVIGQVFLRKFVAIYSYEPKFIGLVRSVNDIIPSSTPDKKNIDDELPVYEKVLIGIVVFIAVAALAYFGYYKYKQRKNKNQKIEESTTSSIEESLTN